MAIQQKLQARLAQKLILTPSLQQAIKLLPMSTLELAELLTQEMVEKACSIALKQEMAKLGDRVVITAGVPFGTPGSTNILRVAWVEE